MILSGFRSLVDAAPDAPALIDGRTGEITSRSGLARAASALATALRDRELGPRDAVGVQLPNSTEFVAAVLASMELDLVVAPIDRDAPESEVSTVAGHFSMRAVITRSADGEIAIRLPGERRGHGLPREARLVKLTSGSTGMPKGIVCTEENLAADCRNICSSMEIRPDDVNLGAIPFSHSYGFSNLVTPLLLQGTAIVVSNDYLPQSLIDLANRARCTVAPLIPMVFDHLASAGSERFETVRTFISAGAPLPAATSRRFRERFGIAIHSFYGCSECGGITYDRAGSAAERGTVGTALDGVTLALNGSRLSVSGANVAAGLMLDASTWESLNGEFLTDDFAEMRDDEVVLTGREGDLINTAGKKVNPREVEAVILEIDGVRDARVYGEPAGARGEVVAAAVAGAPDLTPELVRRHCLSRLAAHKVPRIVKLVDRLPLDERGKVKRAALRAL